MNASKIRAMVMAEGTRMVDHASEIEPDCKTIEERAGVSAQYDAGEALRSLAHSASDAELIRFCELLTA